MPITFEQPGPFDAGISSAYGAAQAMKDFAPFLSRAYPGGGDGGGGGGRGGGGGIQGLGGGGGGGGDGGVLPAAVDPVALYAGKQQVDRYFEEQDRQQAIREIQGNTAGGDVGQMDEQIQQLQGRQQKQFESDVANEDQPYGGRPGPPSTKTPDEGGDWGGGGTGEDQNIDQASVEQSAQQAAQAQPAPQQPPEFTQADALQLQRLTASRAEVQAQLRNGAIDQGTARRMIAQLQVPISVMRQQQQAMQTQAMQQEMQQRQHAAAEATTIENMNDQQRSQYIARRTVRLPNGGWGYVDRKGDIKPLPQDHLDRQQTALSAARDRQQAHDDASDDRFLKREMDLRKFYAEHEGERQMRDLPSADDPSKTERRRETTQEAVHRHMEEETGHGTVESRQQAREAQRLHPPISGNSPGDNYQREHLQVLDRAREQIADAARSAPTPERGRRWQEAMNREVDRLRTQFRERGSVEGMGHRRAMEYDRALQNIRNKISEPWGDEGQAPVISDSMRQQALQRTGFIPGPFAGSFRGR